ncbi:MAG: hypothetical protein ABW168_04030, partial [Sedimenticola sp.]
MSGINHHVSIHSVMKCMGYEGVSRITDGAILNIINEFDGSPDLSKLSQIIIDIYGESYFLINAQKRKILFDYLQVDVAKELCGILGC